MPNNCLNSEEEVRKNLAIAYRVLGHLGLDDHTYTHLTARPVGEDFFFIYPFGLRFEEVTADNLLKVTLSGQVLEGSEAQYNRTGYIIHGTLYQQRSDINAIFHLHTPTTVAVSSVAEGLLPISQWAMHFYEKIAYNDYNSLALDVTEGKKLVASLGNKLVMLLRNHGSICCGKTIQEAMFYTYHLEQATKTQIAIMAMNLTPITPPKNILQQTVNDVLNFEKNLGERDWKAWVRLDQRLK